MRGRMTAVWGRFLLGALVALSLACPVWAVDYTKNESWINRPSASVMSVDCFYLYPTIVAAGADGSLNVPIEDKDHRAGGAAVYQYQASVFARLCNIYAPYYRLAGMNAFSLPPEEAEKYLASAYSDVRDAFAHYLKSSDKPFILAGHSQGASMLKKLMSEFMTDATVSKRLVAAYLFGIDVTEDYLRRNPHLKFASGRKDVGVIIAYNSRTSEALNADFSDKITFTDLRGMAINPLTWRRDESYAPPWLNYGAVFFRHDTDGKVVSEEIKEYADAQINNQNGVIVVRSIARGDKRTDWEGFPRGILHVGEINMFYRNIEQNACQRIHAYLNIPHY